MTDTTHNDDDPDDLYNKRYAPMELREEWASWALAQHTGKSRDRMSAKLVLAWLCYQLDNAKECSLSVGRLANRLHLGRDTVRGALHRLENIGLIAIRPQLGGKNTYRVFVEKPLPPGKTLPPRTGGVS